MQADKLTLSCNVIETVCVVFNPSEQDRLVISEFPCFKIGDSYLKFVNKFKYLGHFITSNLSPDADIQREIQNMFVRQVKSSQIIFNDM